MARIKLQNADEKLEFMTKRSNDNLQKSIEYREVLVRAMIALEGNVYSNKAIIQEIERVLK